MARLSNKHRATLAAIFKRPTRSDIEWKAIEALFRALGAVVSERSGSRVAIELGDVCTIYHRPHPQKAAKKYVVEAARDQITRAGFKP